VQTIPLAVEPDQNLLTAHPSHMPMRDLPLAAVRQADDIRAREKEIAVWVGFNALASRPEQNYDAAGNARTEQVRQSRKRIHRLDTEMHRRWASGFTCLAMAMIGIPLAIRMKASDAMTTFGIVFLPTVLVYYPIFALTLDMAKDGRLIAAGVWIANAIFIAASVLLLRQLIYRPN
jgi:lipopolysaccharide export system permease protein